MQIPQHPRRAPLGAHSVSAASGPGLRLGIGLAILGLLPTTGLTSGCAGPAQHPILGEPEGHPGFPSETFVEEVWAEARFVGNHARVLGQDLSEDFGLVPVALRLGHRTDSPAGSWLDPESIDPVLFLQDGTPLAWVPPEDLEQSDDRIAANTLPMTLLPTWGETRGGFLFFSAAAAGVRLRGRNALVVKEHINLELDLLGSVLAFTISTPSGPRRVYLGLGLERWEAKR